VTGLYFFLIIIQLVMTAHNYSDLDAEIAVSSDDDGGDTDGEETWIATENSECKPSLDLDYIVYSC